jgi:hypothetical protein
MTAPCHARRRLGLVVAASLFAASSQASARWTDFLPKPFENGLTVEMFGSHEREDDRGSAVPFGWTDTFFREEVALFSNGYFYHPRFLLYRLSVSGALKQENYEVSTAANAGWLTGTGFEYDARLFALPEHPYNFEVFAVRREPLYMEQSAVLHDSVETANGAQFRFRQKPFFAHAGYLDNTTRSSAQSANVKRLSADGQYYKNYAGGNQLSLNASYNDSWFTGSGGVTGNSQDYGGGGFLEVPRVRLNASATQSNSEEDSAALGRAENDRFSFNEVLALDLPANFRVDLSYRIFDNTSKNPVVGGGGTIEREERTQDEQLEVNQRLYQSLDSRYVFLHRNRDSSAGDSTLVSHALSFDYTKSIPRGRVQLGVNGSRIDSDNRGRTDIVSEPHAGTAVPGTFLLGQPFAEVGSIDISLPSPIPPFTTVHLIENTHFTVASVGNNLEITVFALPPVFTVPGTYDLTVSYSLATGTFELLTNTYGFNVSVPLLDNLITPYADYIAVRSDVVTGTFPGTNPDSTTYTVGMSFLDGPWHALGEYQNLDWAISPYQSLKGEVQYIGTLAPATRIYATGTVLHRYYSTGSSSQATGAYSDDTATLSGNLQQDFLARSLTLATGASYSRMSGRVDGYSYSANASLTWKVGKLDVIAGASAYGSQTQAFTYTQYDRAHQFYYFRLRRQFSK